MSTALHSIVWLMPFNSKIEQIESRTASWNGLCSTFEGPMYMNFKNYKMYKSLVIYNYYMHVIIVND
jgi:hypothetical protein